MAEKNLFDLDSKVSDVEIKQSIPGKTPEINGDMRPKPKLSARVSNKFVALFGVLALVLGWIFWDSTGEMDARKHRPPPVQEEDSISKANEDSDVNKAVPKELSAGLYDDTTGKRITTLVKPEQPKPVIPGTDADTSNGVRQVPSIREARQTDAGDIPLSRNSQGGDKGKAMTPAQIAAEAERDAARKYMEDRLSRMQQARLGGLRAVPFNADKSATNGTSSMSSNGNMPESQAQPGELTDQLNTLKSSIANANAQYSQGSTGSIPRIGGVAGAGGQGGDQQEKGDFVKNAGNEAGYHPYREVPAISKNEIKVGTYVPMILNQSINSDLPGQITARVSENVWDTVSGCRLLIPAMTTVIGRYDSKVAAGQTRNLIVWNHMVFADGAELNLGSMQGYGTNGTAGLDADVDNHFWKLFGLTLGMSTITATMQAAVPQQNNTGNTVQNPGQLLQQQIAQQYGQLGSQIIGKYLAVQPTLKNYAGERFMITVPHTIIMDKVWRLRCSG